MFALACFMRLWQQKAPEMALNQDGYIPAGSWTWQELCQTASQTNFQRDKAIPDLPVPPVLRGDADGADVGTVEVAPGALDETDPGRAAEIAAATAADSDSSLSDLSPSASVGCGRGTHWDHPSGRCHGRDAVVPSGSQHPPSPPRRSRRRTAAMVPRDPFLATTPRTRRGRLHHGAVTHLSALPWQNAQGGLCSAGRPLWMAALISPSIGKSVCSLGLSSTKSVTFTD